MILLNDCVSQRVLTEIVPAEVREAVQQGFLYIHSLSQYFGSEVTLPELRHLPSADGTEFILGVLGAIKKATWQTSSICIPHFDFDLGYTFKKHWPDLSQQVSVMSQMFEIMASPPRLEVTLNLGDDITEGGRLITKAVLSLLGGGHTKLEPQVVFRIKRGINLLPADPNFDLLTMALNIAKDRKGIAFSLMDSTLNSQWISMVAYNAHGLRIEPQRCDLYKGSRGQVMLGRVSLNVPLLESSGDKGVESGLELAARLLAHRLEVSQISVDKSMLPLVVNLSGVTASRASFETIERLSNRLNQLSKEYACNFLLSSMADDVSFAYAADSEASRKSSYTLEASIQHLLPGGHCYLAAAGPHMSAEELYQQLLLAEEAGLSFLQFRVDDVRCGECALAVAAPGLCPACGNETRRIVEYRGTRLEECVRLGENAQGPAFFWVPS